MKLWYMNDNHTFCELPHDVEGALAVVRGQFERGQTHGDFAEFEPRARAWLVGQLTYKSPGDLEYESWPPGVSRPAAPLVSEPAAQQPNSFHQTSASGVRTVQTALPRWIPVTERPPNPEVFVLCWDGKQTFVEWFGSKPDAGRGVTHWIPYRMPPGATSPMHDGRRAGNGADNASPRSDKKEVPASQVSQGLPSPHVDPIDTYKKPVEMEEEIRRNALTAVALGEDGLCKSCGYAPWCRKNGRCYRSMQPLTAGVKGDGRG